MADIDFLPLAEPVKSKEEKYFDEKKNTNFILRL
jgi:hypothetical protein